MPITIEATGLHPCTEACLESLKWLQDERSFHQILDVGCGNGILSLAAAVIWDAPVLATDISEQAVHDTQQNIAHHQMEARVTALRSDGFQHPDITARAPYDFMMINLLAEPIIQMAPAVCEHLAEDGCSNCACQVTSGKA